MPNHSFKAYNTKEKRWSNEAELWSYLDLRSQQGTLKFNVPPHIIKICSTGLLSATGEELWMGDICTQELQNQFGSISKVIGILWWFEQELRFSIRYSTEIPMADYGSATAPVRLGNIFDNPEAIPENIPSFINFTPPAKDSSI